MTARVAITATAALAELIRRQENCEHEWEHRFVTHGAHGYSSSWCRKCGFTDQDELRRIREKS